MRKITITGNGLTLSFEATSVTDLDLKWYKVIPILKKWDECDDIIVNEEEDDELLYDDDMGA